MTCSSSNWCFRHKLARHDNSFHLAPHKPTATSGWIHWIQSLAILVWKEGSAHLLITRTHSYTGRWSWCISIWIQYLDTVLHSELWLREPIGCSIHKTTVECIHFNTLFVLCYLTRVILCKIYKRVVSW